MVILLRKRDLFAAALFCCVIFCCSLGIKETIFVSSVSALPVPIVVDAGHGGEDGGAVSASGVKESDLNLQIAQKVDGLIRFLGQATVMTRNEDVSLADQGLKTIRKRKTSDLQNRVSAVNSASASMLISIHQNSLPSSPLTHGAQVFWNKSDRAEELASIMQEMLNTAVNRGNEKSARPIADTIYLTGHVFVPAAVVECGFLSNADETVLLQQKNHQMRVAAAVTAGALRFLKGETS